jgi:AcrR family transcriptional regulator
MPRNRTISDEALLDHALLVLRDAGPDGLTFGAVARQAGLAASTIVQRFGSKPGLLRATLLRAWDRLDDDTDAAIAAAGRGTRGVVDLLVRLSGQYAVHDYADQLRVLREDLLDPVLTERGRSWLAVLAHAIEARVPGTSGMLVLAQWQGTLTVWSFTREAAIEDMVRRNVTAVLARRSS